jgi:uncharacterized membrane protein YidH (DUF202 family)
MFEKLPVETGILAWLRESWGRKSTGVGIETLLNALHFFGRQLEIIRKLNDQGPYLN